MDLPTKLTDRTRACGHDGWLSGVLVMTSLFPGSSESNASVRFEFLV